MKKQRAIRQFFTLAFISILSAGCGGRTVAVLTTTPLAEATSAPIEAAAQTPSPAAVIDPANAEMYEPVPESVCRMIRDEAADALGVEFIIESPAPFLDAPALEAGRGCRMVATGNGNNFSSPQKVVETLIDSAGVGWTDQPTYRADGPMGSAAGLARDMALMLIKADWAPDMGLECPLDQPVSGCTLTSEQQIYSIQIDIAQYRADFSMDGHWEDTSTGFSLDLYQDWKNIYGHHEIVAQGGNKIDTLDVSINGILQGKTVDVQFQSSFTSEPGVARITYVDVQTIHWKIVTPPDGEYYLPAEATLKRQ